MWHSSTILIFIVTHYFLVSANNERFSASLFQKTTKTDLNMGITDPHVVPYIQQTVRKNINLFNFILTKLHYQRFHQKWFALQCAAVELGGATLSGLIRKLSNVRWYLRMSIFSLVIDWKTSAMTSYQLKRIFSHPWMVSNHNNLKLILIMDSISQ